MCYNKLGTRKEENGNKKLASGQTEEMGRMRIEIIASDMQETLSEATHSLDRVGADFEQAIIGGADSEEIRSLLSEEKKAEIASTGCMWGCSASVSSALWYSSTV